jgi:AcrR family transcriptional regulator
MTSLTHHVATHATSVAGASHGPRLSADERRAEIVEAAVKAFASGGLAGTSTEDIARLAGVSQPYLFRLFGTKRDLFLAAVGRAFDRVEAEFDAAAAHPDPEIAAKVGINPVLYALAMRYQALLADRTLLRLQLHAYAACDDPEVRLVVRARFAHLVTRVAALSGEPAEGLRTFFAEGMLLNVAATMDLAEADVAWQHLCEGGPT